MNLEFFKRPVSERALIIRETAAQRGLLAVMVEKDFWVSWTLAVLFAHPEFGNQLVFKGGTSLSKVFGVIERFSEDIDLSVSPAFLGISEESVEQAGSRNKRTERMQELEKACIERVRDRFLPELERIASEVLGNRSGGAPWMEFQVDALTHSPVVLFHYPCTEPSGFEYLRRFVKMEFGSLTDQRPVGTHAVRPWVAEVFPKVFGDFRCELVALELERTFWEKATILHAEHHRDRTKPIREHFSRHYSDMAALARHDVAERALARDDLRQRVANWKSRFFAASWARYDLAKPGTFRLAPPEFRLAELEKDYHTMRDMFLAEPPSFESVIKTVSDLEQEINGRQPA
ncbi:MAG: nucleotidyl transferase AbiEii/AbiGii toxin family protein [Verrucomicrobiota bacterium]